MRLVAEVTRQPTAGGRHRTSRSRTRPTPGIRPPGRSSPRRSPAGGSRAGLREDNRVHVGPADPRRRPARSSSARRGGRRTNPRRARASGGDARSARRRGIRSRRTSQRSGCCVRSPAPVEPHVDSRPSRHAISSTASCRASSRDAVDARVPPAAASDDVAHEVVAQCSSGRSTSREIRKPRLTSSSVPSNARSSCSIETT